ncbi:MAG: peptide-methionine (S)-S-oxide reductase [Burkholderiales bacterium]|nr:peptide-methionine (S)-S-oxide reductase [Burkholderiales bacterium]
MNRRWVKQYIDQLNKSGWYNAPIATEVAKASVFWPAEDRHQSYFLKMGQRYGGLL